MNRKEFAAWAGPFALFMLLLAVVPQLKLPPTADLSIRLILPAVLYLWLSRGVVEWRWTHVGSSVLLGVAVFVMWVLPDVLWPGYREHWLFQNSLLGRLEHSVPPAAYLEPFNVTLRVARAVLLVPLIEEMFWRGFLMRWLINPDFARVPLGAYQTFAFWATAVLFAVEHGPYWEVGLAAGIAYNWWLVRTKELSGVIVAHAVTNLCLAVFVLMTKRWEFWM